MSLNLFNSLGRKKTVFVPIAKRLAKIYVCGPTVYDFVHLGNFRSYIFSDVLIRMLKHLGFGVTFVRNITDVGHLTDDADQGEDKIEQAAQKSGKKASEIAEFYTKKFNEDAGKLILLSPTGAPRASEHVNEQIEFIKELEQKGSTYQTADGIYFDTAKLSDYGKLVGKKAIEGAREGARIEANPERKNPTDFALWKFSPKNEKRQMEWPSPWGVGFPGWHIECSAMSRKYLGFPFDIHTGGIDHLPIHHTNEIAQNEAVSGQKSVNFWLHNEFMMVDSQKMSKSLGNIIILDNLIERDFEPLSFRYLSLLTHYRQKLNFTWAALLASQSAYRRLVELGADWLEKTGDLIGAADSDWMKKIDEAVGDDLNTPEAVAALWQMTKDQNITEAAKLGTLLRSDNILGLKLKEKIEETVRERQNVPEEVKNLVQVRESERTKKDWPKADQTRKQIEKLGFWIDDTPEGPRLKKIKNI